MRYNLKQRFKCGRIVWYTVELSRATEDGLGGKFATGKNVTGELGEYEGFFLHRENLKLVAHKPARVVHHYDLDAMSFNENSYNLLLSGDFSYTGTGCFVFSATPQGREYWAEFHYNNKEMTEEARLALLDMCTQYESENK